MKFRLGKLYRIQCLLLYCHIYQREQKHILNFAQIEDPAFAEKMLLNDISGKNDITVTLTAFYLASLMQNWLVQLSSSQQNHGVHCV